jgi:hypothetical protein
VSLAGQQIHCVLLPDAHQSRAARDPEELERKLFILFYQSLRECSTIKTTVGMALALKIIEPMLKRQSNSTF